MFGISLVTLALGLASVVAPSQAGPPTHHSPLAATQRHPSSVHFTTGTLAQVCTNASSIDRLFGKRDECSLVDPGGTTAEHAYYQACARHGTTGLLDCHIGYSFKYVTVPDRDGGHFAACFRGCAPFLADVQRAEDARRSEQIPMVFGSVQAAGERIVAEVAAEASGLDLDASSVAVSRTDMIVRELVRPGVIYRDSVRARAHTIVGNVDDARALFDTLSAGGKEVTPLSFQEGGTVVQFADGTQISFRPNAGYGKSPAVEIFIPSYTQKWVKLHFTEH